jgi:uncharacterized protein YdaL
MSYVETKIEIVTIKNDTEIAGCAIVPAGNYTVEMPQSYEPGIVDAYALVYDGELTIIPDTDR